MPVEVALEAQLTDLAFTRIEHFGCEPHDTASIGLPRFLETQHIADIVFELAHQICKIFRKIVPDVLEVDLDPASLKCPATEKGGELVFGWPPLVRRSVLFGSGGLEDASQVV
jgi:hypothetical protein